MNANERLLMRIREAKKLLDESSDLLEYAEDSADIFLEDYVEFESFNEDDDEDEYDIKDYKEEFGKAKKLIQKLAKHAQKVEENHDAVIDSVDEMHEAVVNAIYDYELAKSIGE